MYWERVSIADGPTNTIIESLAPRLPPTNAARAISAV